MTVRLFVPGPLHAGATLALPPAATRHAQVRRVQPGHALVLFDGSGVDWPAEVLAMTRSEVVVRLGAALAVDRELACAVTLAVGMPANERMDTLVEKAAELGVAALHPLQCERSVLKLDGGRAERKRAHWQAIAAAACEQCGRAVVPVIEPIRVLAEWLDAPPAAGVRLLLSLARGAPPLNALPAHERSVLALSGPEGGLTPAEEEAACRVGFAPVSLGTRVLRAETAPLALLAWIGLRG